jgi:diaminopropionate ammonia-lyase
MSEEILYPCGIRAVHDPADPMAIPPLAFGHGTMVPIRTFQASVPGYAPTPLVALTDLADRLGLGQIFVKDESTRYGLGAFKGLGAIHAIGRVLCRKFGLEFGTATFRDLTSPERREQARELVFCTATDGNHGKGVAWAAAQFGCGAQVFMPQGTVQARVQAIEAWGATVTVTDLDYDGTVALAAKTAEEQNWVLLQDTGWEGYTEAPNWIAQGYCTLADEAAAQVEAAGYRPPTHVLVQAGVGSFAAAILAYYAHIFADDLPTMIVVEPDSAAGILTSAAVGDGAPHTADRIGPTEMAGLNCPTPNPLIWPVLRDHASFYVACPDWVTENGMRLLAHPAGEDRPIVSGESGAVTAGLLEAIMTRPDLRPLRTELGLDETSVVLLFSTEGDTDPANYRRIVDGE